jgi:hypothetical protein
MPSDHQSPSDPIPDPAHPPSHRPVERLWPFVDLSEHHSQAELDALEPELRAALFGPLLRPFSVTLAFPVLDSPDYERAVEMARASAEYQETGHGRTFRHRARFFPRDVLLLRDLFQLVGPFDECEVLIDDHPVPYARELWLPLMWFLIHRTPQAPVP